MKHLLSAALGAALTFGVFTYMEYDLAVATSSPPRPAVILPPPQPMKPIVNYEVGEYK